MTVAELITALKALNAKADDVTEVFLGYDAENKPMFEPVMVVYKPEDNVVRFE